MVNLEDFCRFWLGGLTEEELSCEELQQLFDMTFTQYSDVDDCELKYRSLVNILQYLIRKSSKGLVGSSGKGAITKREEERGNTRIREEYSEIDSAASWSTVLEELIENPDSIGCDVFPEETDPSKKGGSVIIGVSKCRFDSVSPWRQNLITPTRKLW